MLKYSFHTSIASSKIVPQQIQTKFIHKLYMDNILYIYIYIYIVKYENCNFSLRISRVMPLKMFNVQMLLLSHCECQIVPLTISESSLKTGIFHKTYILNIDNFFSKKIFQESIQFCFFHLKRMVS